jgi:hypothetical protein
MSPVSNVSYLHMAQHVFAYIKIIFNSFKWPVIVPLGDASDDYQNGVQ